jgi:hypothetical protein
LFSFDEKGYEQYASSICHPEHFNVLLLFVKKSYLSLSLPKIQIALPTPHSSCALFPCFFDCSAVVAYESFIRREYTNYSDIGLISEDQLQGCGSGGSNVMRDALPFTTLGRAKGPANDMPGL